MSKSNAKQNPENVINVAPKKMPFSNVPLKNKIAYGSVLTIGVVGATCALVLVKPHDSYQVVHEFSYGQKINQHIGGQLVIDRFNMNNKVLAADAIKRFIPSIKWDPSERMVSTERDPMTQLLDGNNDVVIYSFAKTQDIKTGTPSPSPATPPITTTPTSSADVPVIMDDPSTSNPYEGTDVPDGTPGSINWVQATIPDETTGKIVYVQRTTMPAQKPPTYDKSILDDKTGEVLASHTGDIPQAALSNYHLMAVDLDKGEYQTPYMSQMEPKYMGFVPWNYEPFKNVHIINEMTPFKQVGGITHKVAMDTKTGVIIWVTDGTGHNLLSKAEIAKLSPVVSATATADDEPEQIYK